MGGVGLPMISPSTIYSWPVRDQWYQNLGERPGPGHILWSNCWLAAFPTHSQYWSFTKAQVQGCWKVCQHVRTLQSTGQSEATNHETAVRQEISALRLPRTLGILERWERDGERVRAQCVHRGPFSLLAGDAPSADAPGEARPRSFRGGGRHRGVLSHQDVNTDHCTSTRRLPLKMGTWGHTTAFLQLSRLNY